MKDKIGLESILSDMWGLGSALERKDEIGLEGVLFRMQGLENAPWRKRWGRARKRTI